MKREIKFRAWHTGAKEMLYPTYHGVTKQSYVFSWIEEGQPVEIMQFTGLKDKNGKEIYEGDIITSRLYPLQDGYTHDVYFKDGDFLVRWTMFRLSEMFDQTHTDIEVTGNIYENLN